MPAVGGQYMKRLTKMTERTLFFTKHLCKVLIILTALSVQTPSPAAGAAKPGAGALGVEVGKLAPEFTLQNARGEWVSLSDFRGEKVFLFSWATWCRCREQLPELEKFYQKFKSDGFEVIAVASDSEGFKWVQPYLDGADATFTALVDPNHELARKYNFLATENGFLIDEDGVIRMSAIGYDIRKPEQRDELVRLTQADFKVDATPEEKKSLEERIETLVAAIAEKPKSISKRMSLAELYRQQADYEKAESTLLEVTKIKKRFAEAHFRLGVVLYQQGRIEEAVKSWEKAYRYDITSYIYMRTLEAHKEPEKFYSAMMEEEEPL